MIFSFSLILAQTPVERSVLSTVQEIFKREKGQITFSSLINSPEFSDEEKEFIGRLYEILFAIPAYLKTENELGSIPTRQGIASQFAVSPYSIELLLKVLETDRRIPPLFIRSESGEITSLNSENIDQFLASRGGNIKFTGWEGNPVPSFSLRTFDGKEYNDSDLKGKNSLIYFWFTGCPPCVKIAPILAELSQKYQPKGFNFIGINADDVLDLGTSIESRKTYLSKVGIDFTALNLSDEVRKNFGTINVYPILFFVSKDGIIYKRLVNFQTRETLVETMESMLSLN
jgi:thiol-disulfide isomerase/thioredoxin